MAFRKTWKGKVVYSRPRHPFTLRDAQRIVRSVTDEPANLEESVLSLALAEMLIMYWVRWAPDTTMEAFLSFLRRILSNLSVERLAQVQPVLEDFRQEA